MANGRVVTSGAPVRAVVPDTGAIIPPMIPGAVIPGAVIPVVPCGNGCGEGEKGEEKLRAARAGSRENTNRTRDRYRGRYRGRCRGLFRGGRDPLPPCPALSR